MMTAWTATSRHCEKNMDQIKILHQFRETVCSTYDAISVKQNLLFQQKYLRLISTSLLFPIHFMRSVFKVLIKLYPQACEKRLFFTEWLNKIQSPITFIHVKANS